MTNPRFTTPAEFVAFLASNGGSIGTDTGFVCEQEGEIARQALDQRLVAYDTGNWGDQDWYVLPKPNRAPLFSKLLRLRG